MRTHARACIHLVVVWCGGGVAPFGSAACVCVCVMLEMMAVDDDDG